MVLSLISHGCKETPTEQIADKIETILQRMLVICDKSQARSEQFQRELAQIKEKIAAREKNSSLEANPIVSVDIELVYGDGSSEILVELAAIEDDNKDEKRLDALVANHFGNKKTPIPIVVAIEDLVANTRTWKEDLEKVEKLGSLEANSNFGDSFRYQVLTIDYTFPTMEIQIFPSPPPKPPDHSNHMVFPQFSQSLPPKPPDQRHHNKDSDKYPPSILP